MRATRHRNGYDDRPMAEINVTPLVDVMLVLLIIFMVAAPMMQMGIDVNLPRVEAKSINVAEEKLILTINASKEIYLNKSKLTLTSLGVTLKQIFTSRVEREVYLRADKNVPYGFVVEVMAEVRKAGIDKLGMITEPPEERR
ncbi:MAG: protein TolR [Syntrophaceae bacterium]|nr:protein TolR [Syntrophaceae bacterium]